MKILVTGGAGFIGSHLVDEYVAHGHEVIVLDDMSTGRKEHIHPKARLVAMSLSDTAMEDFIRDEKPDLINHHAAQVNVRNSVCQPVNDLEINLRNTVRLLQAAGHAKVRKIIFASSGGTVYGETPRVKIAEDFRGRPISPYGINKLAAEYYLRFMAEQYTFSWTILRYSNVYGPRQSSHGESGVISIFAERLRKKLAPIIYGNGEQVRDFVHVEDVVAANMLFSRLEGASNDVFNVGTGQGTSLNSLVRLMAKMFPGSPPPVYQQAKPGDLQWNVLSVEKLQTLGWTPKVTLEEGIKRMALST